MAYVQTGFTPEEEQELLGMKPAVAKLQAWTENQDRLRVIQTAALIAGFLYTLARFGDLFSERRDRKRALELKLPSIGEK